MADVIDDPYHCPHCGAVSHNPNDKREEYCGRCHRWADPSWSEGRFGALDPRDDT